MFDWDNAHSFPPDCHSHNIVFFLRKPYYKIILNIWLVYSKLQAFGIQARDIHAIEKQVGNICMTVTEH